MSSGATSKATWFIEATADTGPPGLSMKPWWVTPAIDSGASGNQKNASVWPLPLPMSKKKCWPRPPGSSTVFTSGKPSTLV